MENENKSFKQINHFFNEYSPVVSIILFMPVEHLMFNDI